MTIFFFHFRRNLGSPSFNVFLSLELIYFASLLEELTTQEKSICSVPFLSYDAVNHVSPDPLSPEQLQGKLT